jgi:hypothetical protein
MPVTSCLRKFHNHRCRRVHTPRRGPSLRLEQLESRTVPTILFDNATTATVSDGGGPVITHPDVDLVFWGSGWDSAQTLMSSVTSSINTLMNSPYLSGLSQYRGVGNGQLLRTDFISTTSPAANSSYGDFAFFLQTNLNNGTLPVTPNMDSQILYMVIPQPGTTDPIDGFQGEHNRSFSNVGPFHYGWTQNIGSVDDITRLFSHELTEAVTDPEGTAFQVNPTNSFSWNEICDGEAENYTYRLDGVLVQSYFSQADNAYAIYDGNTQDFLLSSTLALTVNGDQLADPDDTFTVAVVGGGYAINLNGEMVQFDPGKVTYITINTLSGNDTVNIEDTLRSIRPVTVNLGDGTETVNLSPQAQTLSNLAGAVTINGGSGSDTLNLFDQGSNSATNYTVTSSTVAGSGLATVTYQSLAALALNTSNGTDTITVQNTSAGTTVAVNGGSGTNTLVGSAVANTWTIAGSNAGTLSSASIAGPVSFTAVQNLTGGSGNDTFTFCDGAGITGNIAGGGSYALDYSAYTSDVTVDLQAATATGVGGTINGLMSLTGGGGNNTLVAADTPDIWNLTGSNTGTVSGASTVAFTGFQNLLGGAGGNTFVFSDGAGISGNLDGGSSGGSLDYSAYSSSVLVDLQTGFATGVGGSVSAITTVIGGSAAPAANGVYNLLIGAGGDTLTGGMGRRNILVAGASASTLNAGDGEDLLIAGSTAYDTEAGLNDWQLIAAYWSGSDDYATRVANLTTGTDVPLLDASIVTGNGGGNTLNGNGALALFYTDGLDTINGFDPGSQPVTITP